MTEFKLDIPNCKHKFVVVAENEEVAQERYNEHFGIRDEN